MHTKSLARKLSDRIDAAEQKLNHKLQDKDRVILQTSLERFVETYIEKFVRGAATHGLPLTSRPCLLELEHELLDAWAYLQAHKHNLISI